MAVADVFCDQNPLGPNAVWHTAFRRGGFVLLWDTADLFLWPQSPSDQTQGGTLRFRQPVFVLLWDTADVFL
jgi:hypothetical protein